MINFRIIQNLNLNLTELISGELSLIKVRKILRNYSKAESDLSIQEAENIINFIENHHGNFAEFYRDKNFNAIIYCSEKDFSIKIKTDFLKTKDFEKFKAIIDNYLTENIEQFIQQLILKNEWQKLNYFISEYSEILNIQSDSFLSEKLKSYYDNLEIIFESNSVPEQYLKNKTHFSTDKYFYSTLLSYDSINFYNAYNYSFSSGIINLSSYKSEVQNEYYSKIIALTKKNVSFLYAPTLKDKLFLFFLKNFYFIISTVLKTFTDDKSKTKFAGFIFVLVLVVFPVMFYISVYWGISLLISYLFMRKIMPTNDEIEDYRKKYNDENIENEANWIKRRKIEIYSIRTLMSLLLSPFIWAFIWIFRKFGFAGILLTAVCILILLIIVGYFIGDQEKKN